MFTLLNGQKFIPKLYSYKDTRAEPRLAKPKHIVKTSN